MAQAKKATPQDGYLLYAEPISGNTQYIKPLAGGGCLMLTVPKTGPASTVAMTDVKVLVEDGKAPEIVTGVKDNASDY